MPRPRSSVFKSVSRSTAAAIFALAISQPVFSGISQAADTITVAILATPSADGADARKEYSEKVNPLGIKAGITNIKGIPAAVALVGSSGYRSVFMLDFATAEDARAFFGSAEYEALIPLRNAGYDKYDVLIGQ